MGNKKKKQFSFFHLRKIDLLKWSLFLIIALLMYFNLETIFNFLINSITSVIEEATASLENGSVWAMVLVILKYVLIIGFSIYIIYLGFRRWIIFLRKEESKPTNTYQYGDTEFMKWKDKKENLVRSDVNLITVRGIPVDYKKERILHFFGFQKLLSEEKLFTSTMQATNEADEDYENHQKDISNLAEKYMKVQEEIQKEIEAQKNIEEKKENKNIESKPNGKFRKFIKRFISITVEDVVYINTFQGHCLINAASRGGKTTNLVLPLIDLWSKIKNFNSRPNILISDPKGELFENSAEILKARGYEVKILNVKEKLFRNTNCYNPLKTIYNEYKEQFDIVEPHLDMKKIEEGGIPEYYEQLQKLDSSVSYSLEGAIKKIESFVGILITDNEKDPFWSDNPKGMLSAILFYLLEISVIANDSKKFSLNSISTYLSSENFKIDDSGASPFSINLKKMPMWYFASKVFPIVESSNQMSTFMTTILSSVKLYAGAVGPMTTINSIDLDEFVDNKTPTAIFIITPDYDPTFNGIITMMVDQIYELAANTADDLGGKLNRPLEILLDEFANIPKINAIQNKLTVCLGRQIRFTMIVQNTEQLEDVYDKADKTILENTHHKIFIGGVSLSSKDYFSKEIGETTELAYDIEGRKLSDLEVRWREEKMLLITPESLGRLTFGECYHVMFNKNPNHGFLVPNFSYMKNYLSTTPEEYFDKYKIDKIHLKIKTNDLFFKDLTKPFEGGLKKRISLNDKSLLTS